MVGCGSTPQKRTCSRPHCASPRSGTRWSYRDPVQYGRLHPIERLTTDPTIGELWPSYQVTLRKTAKQYAKWRWEPIADVWRPVSVRAVNARTFREFFVWRRKGVKGVGVNTLHKDCVLIRQILKYAVEQDLIERIPLIPSPGRIVANPRPWLTRQEWTHLLAVSKQRIADAPNARTKRQRQDVHDFAIMMVGSMRRVDELRTLRFGDCGLATTSNGELTLVMRVEGKRGHRTVIGTWEAADVYGYRLHTPERQADTGLVFNGEHHRDGFRELLIATGLRVDQKTGFQRNLKSLRAIAISFRVLAGADLLTIARNAGTSIAMIDQFYARRLTAEMGMDVLGKPLTGDEPSWT